MISRIYPMPLRRKYGELLEYSGIKMSADRFISLSLFSSVLIGFIAAVLVGFIFGLDFIISFAVCLIAMQVFFYAWLVLKADAKAALIEESLPDALDLMSSNLRAGLTAEKALLLSARPEFGPLKDELDRAGREIALGKDVSGALARMSARIRSEKAEKVFSLIITGIKSGGKLSELLSHAAKNLKEEALIEKKVKSVVAVYVMFIFFAVVAGAPFLFATSTFLVETLNTMMGSIEIPAAPSFGAPMLLSTQSSISIELVMGYVVLMLISISIMASFIIGQISKGNARYGFRYMPVLIFSSVALFYVFRFALGWLIGGTI